jgi:hypothetical protein
VSSCIGQWVHCYESASICKFVFVLKVLFYSIFLAQACWCISWLFAGFGAKFWWLAPTAFREQPWRSWGRREWRGWYWDKRLRSYSYPFGVSVREPRLQYAPYVPHLVPWGTRSSRKRARVDDSSTSTSALKKSHSPSTQIIGIMLLGERILILLFAFLLTFSF